MGSEGVTRVLMQVLPCDDVSVPDETCRNYGRYRHINVRGESANEEPWRYQLDLESERE